MSADNFLGIVKEGKGKWVGYHCCASIDYPFIDCYACIASKTFETTTELKALHEAQRIQGEIYLEYGYNFMLGKRLTLKQRVTMCPCEQKRFMEGVK